MPKASSIAVPANDLPRDESAPPPPSTVALTLADAAAAPKAKPISSPQTPRAVLVALAFIVLAGAAYHAYHNEEVVPAASSALSNSSAVSEISNGLGAPGLDANQEREAGSATRSTDNVDALAESATAPRPADGPAIPEPVAAGPTAADDNSPEQQRPNESPQAADAPAKSARDGTRQRLKDRDAARERSMSALKSGSSVLFAPPTPRSPTQEVSARFQPPTACTDAVAALSLCNQHKLEEGK